MGRRAWRVMIASGGAALVVSIGAAAHAAPSDDRPSLSPIAATFDDITKVTRYRVNLDDPGAGPETEFPKWSWTLEPPADDPGCKNFTAVQNTRFFSTARWAHGDETGCKHEGTDHNGRIDVTVTTRGYTCNATITGTTTHEGPEPNLCFKPTAQPPPPASSSAPSIRDLEKKGWMDTSVAATAAGVTFAGLALTCAVIPEPASKGIAVLGLITAAGYYAVGAYAFYKSKDPPDKNYKRLAELVIPRLPKVNARSGITAAEAAAVNALQANVARIAGFDAAFIASFERAQGAYAARDGTWDRKQSRAAAKFARTEAKLLDTQPALDAALRRAVTQAQVPALSTADAERVSHTGLPPTFRTLARRLGFPNASINAFAKRVAALSPAAITGPVASKFATASTARADHTAARLLRALASRLAKR